MGRGRPGGNPEFGTKFKFDYGNEEKRSEALTIRITPSMLQQLKDIAGDEYRDFCREAIAEKIERQQLAAPTTKTETAELEQVGQPQPHNQTNQADQEQGTGPTLGEQATTPKTRRKAGQTQEQKQGKPRSQTQSRKNSATQKTTEQDQPDKD